MVCCLNRHKFYKIYKKDSFITKTPFSKIYLCQKIDGSDSSNEPSYIVKIQNPLLNKNSINNEINILRKLNQCKYVTKLIYYERQIFSSYLVFQKIEGCHLGNYLKTYKNSKHYINIIKQLLEGFSEIQNYNIIHRDIKLDNIMVSLVDQDNPQIKIIDFGLSVYQNNLNEFIHNEPTGAYGYMSPEMLSGHFYNANCDTWSLGVVCFYIFTGKYPYQINLSELQIIRNFRLPANNLIGNINYDQLKDEKVKNTVKKMLVINRDTRPLINKIKLD